MFYEISFVEDINCTTATADVFGHRRGFDNFFFNTSQLHVNNLAKLKIYSV